MPKQLDYLFHSLYIRRALCFTNFPNFFGTILHVLTLHLFAPSFTDLEKDSTFVQPAFHGKEFPQKGVKLQQKLDII